VATESDLAAYVQRVRGDYIDVDGVFGAQCWDQWSHYAMWLGVPAWPTYTNAGGTWPHQGYACNVYHNARAAGLTKWFEILPAGVTPRPGDVAFWEYGSAWYPWSHVATVLAVTHGGRMLRCLTQNPGAVQIADLITSGIIGYLRPRALITGSVDSSRTPTLTASEKEDLMASKNAGFWYKNGSKQINMITNATSGFCHEFESANGKYNSGIARAYGTGTFEEISKSQADAIKRDCALLRQGK